MKIDRLLGILTVLLRQGQATAPQLAERFEVSVRTIRRDLDALGQAGIPVVTLRGRGGGIALVPGFRLDGQLLEQDGLRLLLSGLWVDLASHYQASLTEKIALLRRGVRERRAASFRYFSPRGETSRTVEPGLVTFQWGAWYLLAWDRGRENFRLFKLARLWDLTLLDETFPPRPLPPEELDFPGRFRENFRLEALFDPAVKYRLVEEYGPDCWETQADGRLLLIRGFSFWEGMLDWVLSFGDRAEVLAPAELRREVARQSKKMSERYGKQDG